MHTECKMVLVKFQRYSTGHSQRNMPKTLTNSYEQIQSFTKKNEVRVNKFIKFRKNEVTTSFLIHENEFVIPNSWQINHECCSYPRTVPGQTTAIRALLSKQSV